MLMHRLARLQGLLGSRHTESALARLPQQCVCAPFSARRSLPRSTGSRAASSSHQHMHSSDQLLFYTEWPNAPRYRRLLEEQGINVVTPAEMTDSRAITFFAGWNPPAGLLAGCPNLKAAMSLGAGVDHILQPGQVPEHVPVLRIVDPLMAQRMATWVAWGVINWQRKMEDYLQAQRACVWDPHIEGRSNRDNCDVRVGVMGFGLMGRASAELLAHMGYRVSAWSRTDKQHQDITCYHGADGLRKLVSSSDVLVCLLPLTPSTIGIINADLLFQLPRGAAVINGARGKQVVEEDLVDALNTGQVGAALLDVFHKEPLPADSPLWTHPHVRLTPHVASMTTLENAANQVAANFHSVVSGNGPLTENLVDKHCGY